MSRHGNRRGSGRSIEHLDHALEPEIAKAVELARLHKRLRRDDNDTITELHVSYATSLDGLRNFPALEILILAGCDPVALGTLPALDQLFSLRIHDSGLHELDGIERFPSLRIFNSERNRLRDLSPLLACDLAIVEVAGNPLSRHSYEEILPQLAQRGCEVSASQPTEWRLTRRMHEAGVPLNCYERRGQYFLCAPGLALDAFPDRDHVHLDIHELESFVHRDPHGLLTLFERGRNADGTRSN